MNILIVDDEALARSRLRSLLTDCAETQHGTLAEAANAAETMARLGPTGGSAFDLVLLDIHMPGLDGLALAHQLRALPRSPAVVFVTAHARHAVSAFDLEALDYLTKPVRRERLLQALAKVQRSAGAAAPAAAAGVPDGESLLIQDRGRTERLLLDEVLYFKAEQKYVTVRTTVRSYIVDSALSELEARFAPRFMRIHRNALVARRAMRALEKHYDSEEGEGWAVRLQGSTELLAVSRRQVAAVRKELAR
ncbi:LytR/AlgR family response regulator transcription factor [Verminephrobacter aporrectodeae]|uniref:LytR/AlgR family response regulator transcription factor n=1 Tax=Verminephrobacter aporrectodeae TaxID=1110389 RepID=UPI00224452F5|nr:LytTR family DNA-binding domain-containing protein [Verminephrobacter aporrectodeae]MCW8175026.1 DNA-binding response regulator [Verminephrobacter aporrectodeae subsp. tuberculatae]MCW8202328.1 DNA-binding response regulator [Verminephrobacter aporrectodeae subsp. tuberculatae]